MAKNDIPLHSQEPRVAAITDLEKLDRKYEIWQKYAVGAIVAALLDIADAVREQKEDDEPKVRQSTIKGYGSLK